MIASAVSEDFSDANYRSGADPNGIRRLGARNRTRPPARATPAMSSRPMADACDSLGSLRHEKNQPRLDAPSQAHEALQRTVERVRSGDLAGAEQILESFLGKAPDSPRLLRLLARLYLRGGRRERAIECFDRAIEVYDRRLAARPRDLITLANRSGVLCSLGRYDEGLECIERALALAPNALWLLPAHSLALLGLNRFAEAIADCDAMIQGDPAHVDAHLQRGQAQLCLGNYASGWRDREWRWKTARMAHWRKSALDASGISAVPQWLGEEDPRGKSILVHSEGGFGENLQFLRFVPLLAEQGANVVLALEGSLKPLAVGMSGAASVIDMTGQLPWFDHYCPLQSLPMALGVNRLDDVPTQVPYLYAPSSHIERWSRRIPRGRKPRVGIVWAGATGHWTERIDNRPVPLQALIPMLSMANVEWYSLQKEVSADDAVLLKGMPGVVQLGAELEDFADTAAAISVLDLVISVDTAVAHLAGALGRAVWVLLSYSRQWRWYARGRHSWWYPTARLFRQQRPLHWQSVLDQIIRALEALAPPR